MMCFKDRTFCDSPNCQNECGRKMTDKEYQEWWDLPKDKWLPISYGYFCGEPEELPCETGGIIKVEFKI